MAVRAHALPPRAQADRTSEKGRLADFLTGLSPLEGVSVAASTLANGGVCPVNGERVLKTRNVQHCLSLMCSCGMYDLAVGSRSGRVRRPSEPSQM